MLDFFLLLRDIIVAFSICVRTIVLIFDVVAQDMERMFAVKKNAPKRSTVHPAPRKVEQETVPKIEKKEFLASSKKKKEHYDKFPTLEVFTAGKRAVNAKVSALTQQIVSSAPSGDPQNRDMVSLQSKEISLWDNIRKSPNIEINGKRAKMIGRTVWSNFCTAKVYPTSGVHRFKLKIIRSASPTSGFMIGIARNEATDTFKSLNTLMIYDDKAYLMIYDGALFPNQRRSLADSGYIHALHGVPWKSGDSFDMNLNMNALTLSYAYNGKDLGVAFRNIAKTNYRFMVALCLQNDEIAIVE